MTHSTIRLVGFVALLAGLLLNSGCDSSSSNNAVPMPAPAPAPPSFSYTFLGSAVKGVIRSAEVSLIDRDGNQLATTSQTAVNGEFQLIVTTTEILTPPLQLQIRNAGVAEVVCDVQPVCEATQTINGETSPVVTSFGDTYDLPVDFRLRAPIQAVQEQESDTFQAIVYVSPISEFVTATALSMSDDQLLTDSNLDVANERVVALLKEIYPDLATPASLQISTVALIDLTDLANARPDSINELSIAITTVSAAIASFVDPTNSERSDIIQVIEDFSAQISSNLSADQVLADNHDSALLAEASLDSFAATVTDLDAFVQAGTIQLPDGIVLDDFSQIELGGLAVLPEIIDIWTNLSPVESTFPVQSNATGWADLVILPETGEARVNLITTDIEATAVHLHQASAGTNGDVLVELERDPVNADRWQFPDNAQLGEVVLTAILRGETYFNVHSDAFPAGEIRGQVLPEGISVISVMPTGLQQVPTPVNSEGFANAALTFDSRSNLSQAHITTTNVEFFAAHIHLALAGLNGDVVVELQQDSQVLNHWFAEDIELSALSSLETAGLYFNLHSPSNPFGELRGQITPPGYEIRISLLNASQVVASNTVESSNTGVSATTTNLTTAGFTIHLNTTEVVGALEAHLHDGNAGENGEVIFDLGRDSTNANHWFLEDQTLSEQQFMKLLNGELYVDVHSTLFEEGEIRGQLTNASVFMDSDADGVADPQDAFPQDPTETTDSDGDGVGDNADVFPADANESADTDSDGVGDNADQCPTDPGGSVDSDGDGICDASEPDSDNDGVPNDQDAFPNDPNESADTDSDGVGDNADAFPMNPAESSDSDNDGVGDQADNCLNTANPNQEDANNDGVGDACTPASGLTLADVQPIFNARCVVCHGSIGSAGLSLIEANSFSNLVNVASSQVPLLDRVEPGDAEMSYLVFKIEGRSGIVGSRMPLGGVLSDGDIQTIKDWINTGANQ